MLWQQPLLPEQYTVLLQQWRVLLKQHMLQQQQYLPLRPAEMPGWQLRTFWLYVLWQQPLLPERYAILLQRRVFVLIIQLLHHLCPFPLPRPHPAAIGDDQRSVRLVQHLGRPPTLLGRLCVLHAGRRQGADVGLRGERQPALPVPAHLQRGGQVGCPMQCNQPLTLNPRPLAQAHPDSPNPAPQDKNWLKDKNPKTRKPLKTLTPQYLQPSWLVDENPENLNPRNPSSVNRGPEAEVAGTVGPEAEVAGKVGPEAEVAGTVGPESSHGVWMVVSL